MEKGATQKTSSISALADDISNHKSFTDKILNIILHPFVLIAGLIATIHFLTRDNQSISSFSHVRDQNSELLGELKKLKKKNKKLQRKLHLLAGGIDLESDEEPLDKIRLKSPAHNRSSQIFYMD